VLFRFHGSTVFHRFFSLSPLRVCFLGLVTGGVFFVVWVLLIQQPLVITIQNLCRQKSGLEQKSAQSKIKKQVFTQKETESLLLEKKLQELMGHALLEESAVDEMVTLLNRYRLRCHVITPRFDKQLSANQFVYQTLEVVASGSYQSIYEYFHDLCHGGRFFPEKISITRNNRRGLTLCLLCKAYSWKEYST
jgi:hypothetical protein